MTIDEWNHALSQIHVGEHAELEFARAWADSVEVDYDEGPCAIGFMKNGGTYWYLIDDVGWDADDPRSEMLAAALEERDAARAECERLRGERDDLLEGRTLATRGIDIVYGKLKPEIEKQTAESIAAWLDGLKDTNRHAECDDTADYLECLAADIRSGAWRKETP